jgi:hydroxymethylbilane synthase
MAPTRSGIVVLATRRSALARKQTEAVQEALARAWPGIAFEKRLISTEGDRTLDRPLPEIGGKGVFTQELEAALRSGQADLAVHSLKDLPVQDPPGLCIGAVLRREDPRDVIVSSNGGGLDAINEGSVVGTSSLRRRSQLLASRPDLRIQSIRGNVETRIEKVRIGEFDAAILAAAGLLRLGLEREIASWLSLEEMLPAPGQGAIAVQCRADDQVALELLAPLDDGPTRAEVEAEREFLAALGGGCTAPVAANAKHADGSLILRGVVASLDGEKVIRVVRSGSDAHELGQSLAVEALALGAQEIIAHANTPRA